MIIMLDADNTIIKAKDIIKGNDSVEKVQRTREGNYTLRAKNHKFLTENEGKPVTRITFIGHSAYEEETGIQCYGGYAAEDFSDLLIERLNQANDSSGREKGFTQNLIAIDLIGCFPGYVSPAGKSFAGEVAERLLKAGYDIPVNAFTNRNLPEPHAIFSMISMPCVEEGKLYIRGFSSPDYQEKYNKMKVVIAGIINDRDADNYNLAEITETIRLKEEEKGALEKKYTVVESKMHEMQGQYESIKKEIKELEDKIKINDKKNFSREELANQVKSVVKYADNTNSKWKDKVGVLYKEIEQINSSQKTEKEKSNATMAMIERTINNIRSHFFTGRGSTTASLLQDIIDNKENDNSFNSLKSLLTAIQQDATIRQSKWKAKTDDLLVKINSIAQSDKNEHEKFTKAFELIKHTSKDIRGHFFGGKRSTVATRLEKILEKKDRYFSQAIEQDDLHNKLLAKQHELNELKTGSEVKNTKISASKLKKNIDILEGEIQRLKPDEQTFKQKVKGLNKKIEEATARMVSFAINIVCTDNVRNYLDSHPECNFTQAVKDRRLKKDRTIQNSGQAGFFQQPSRNTPASCKTAAMVIPSRTNKIR
ncbi:hypothetical protein [Legionella fairfieldensis]|uniref:hypothetical protein n=1 Tax=Legionella fairfieldensis TaxID=45064 RepID=UPI00048EDB21|nr:hypothetical protein [Legionella fairfieldensis]